MYTCGVVADSGWTSLSRSYLNNSTPIALDGLTRRDRLKGRIHLVNGPECALSSST